MDPVTIGAVLLAIVSGAAGEAGSRLWAGLSALVRRPFRHGQYSRDTVVQARSGEAELAALEQAPNDQGRAVALAEMLVARADVDSGFRQALEDWWTQASQVSSREGSVTNVISGGTQHGPVIQGRDFTGLTFGSAPPLPPRPTQE